MRKKAVPGKPDRTDIGRRNILKGVGAASAATAFIVPVTNNAEPANKLINNFFILSPKFKNS